MTQDQIALVRATFAMIEPMAEQTVLLFYTRLSETAPQARVRFASPAMAVRGRKLMTALARVIAVIDHEVRLAAELAELTRLLGRFGFTERNVPELGGALLWTLQRGLGPGAFTPPVREAWAAALDRIAAATDAAEHSAAA